MPGIAGGGNPNTAVSRLRIHVGGPCPGSDHDVGFQVVSPQTHPFRAKETHRPDVSFVEAIRPHNLTLRSIQGIFVKRHIHSQNMR